MNLPTCSFSMALTNSQKKYLRGLTHQLDPVVMIADKGLSENVIAEIELALEHHELIKVKLRTEREQRQQWIEEIGKTTGAELVHQIGQVACYFRRNPKKPKVALPR
jgi:RNA-binding protein